MQSYIVKDRQEETECGHCGGPIYTGERAYFVKGDDYGAVYCSKRCGAYADSDAEHERTGRDELPGESRYAGEFEDDRSDVVGGL